MFWEQKISNAIKVKIFHKYILNVCERLRQRGTTQREDFTKPSYTPVSNNHWIPYFIDVSRIRPSKTVHK